jgi:hypothetical protein
VSERKPPPKRRGIKAAAPKVTRDAPEQPTYGAPGHMGGQFEEAGYNSGGGQFGFRHDTTSQKRS